MPSLLEVQSAFGDALTDGHRAGSTGPLFRGPTDRIVARLAIYRGNIRENCAKALASAYPVVQKIVGREFFEAVAREFVRGHPSTTPDLNRYGGAFADFLEAFPHTADLPYLPDVARMEWLAHRAHFAPDPARLDVATLPGVSPERYDSLRPRLAATCALLESAWPLGRIWTIHQDDYEGDFEVDLDAGPDRILVHRPRWRAQVLSLTPGDFHFLASAARGETLGEALEAAVSADSRFDPATALARWIDAVVVVSLGTEALG